MLTIALLVWVGLLIFYGIKEAKAGNPNPICNIVVFGPVLLIIALIFVL